LALLFVSASCLHEDFFEELLLRPLPDGQLHAHFQFTTRRRITPGDRFEHYHLFPKSLGQVIHKFGVDELHLSFTQGRWWNELWGTPLHDAPVGLELYTWLEEESLVDFKGLVYALSGIFCASMEQMGNSVTSRPRFSVHREGGRNARLNGTDSRLLRYSVLPREAVCTENLTPWMKLLPCRTQAGLSSLLNSFKLYDVQFHSMGTHVRTICEEGNCDVKSLEMQQTLSVVFGKQSEWSFRSLFGKADVVACPLASKSLVYVQQAPSLQL
jgi:phosphatidylinositol glycan class T